MRINSHDIFMKPCPFCGGTAELAENSNGNYFIRCTSCGSRTRFFNENHIGAQMNWNERTSEPVDAGRYLDVIGHLESALQGRGECRNAGDERSGNARIFLCSECGYKVDDIYSNDDEMEWRACPRCGRKVVE